MYLLVVCRQWEKVEERGKEKKRGELVYIYIVAMVFDLLLCKHIHNYELHFTSELVPGNVNWGRIVQFSSQALTWR